MSFRRTASLTAMLLPAGILALAGCGSAGAPTPTPTSTAVAGLPSPTERATPVPTAKPSPSPIPGCLPDCVTPNLRVPGKLSAGANRSRYFFGGQIVVTLPDASWRSREDSTGEYEFNNGNPDWIDAELWLDVYPVVDEPGFPKLPGYDGTAKALVDWVAANRNVKVTARGPATVGGLTGEMIEFERSPKAINLDESCPMEIRPCVNLFRFVQWDGVFSSAGPFKNRLYALDVEWGGIKHAFYAMITAGTVAYFDEFAPIAAPIIEGLQLPPGVHQ
jgi:hypothetical protein